MPASHSFNWDDLKYFLAAAREGTLRGGANSIKANHTTLIRRLALMEEGIGGRLFDPPLSIGGSGFLLSQLTLAINLCSSLFPFDGVC